MRRYKTISVSWRSGTDCASCLSYVKTHSYYSSVSTNWLVKCNLQNTINQSTNQSSTIIPFNTTTHCNTTHRFSIPASKTASSSIRVKIHTRNRIYMNRRYSKTSKRNWVDLAIIRTTKWVAVLQTPRLWYKATNQISIRRNTRITSNNQCHQLTPHRTLTKWP